MILNGVCMRDARRTPVNDKQELYSALEKIVAEAERRTWEAALNLIQEQKKTTDLTREGYVAWAELQIFETKIDAKLYFLTKK